MILSLLAAPSLLTKITLRLTINFKDRVGATGRHWGRGHMGSNFKIQNRQVKESPGHGIRTKSGANSQSYYMILTNKKSSCKL